MSRNPPDLDRLIERCRDADEQAWAQLFQEFNAQVARWVARVDYWLRGEDIPDLVDEVFIKICRTLSHYNAELCSFRVWLYLQSERVALDNIRKRRADKRIPPNVIVSIEEEPDQGPPIVPAEKGPSPDETTAQRDMHRLLFAALDALGPPECRCRQLIGLVYFGGFTYLEAAEALQMKAKTVSSALSKCMTELREIWEKLLPGSDLPGDTND